MVRSGSQEKAKSSFINYSNHICCFGEGSVCFYLFCNLPQNFCISHSIWIPEAFRGR